MYVYNTKVSFYVYEENNLMVILNLYPDFLTKFVSFTDLEWVESDEDVVKD